MSLAHKEVAFLFLLLLNGKGTYLILYLCLSVGLLSSVPFPESFGDKIDFFLFQNINGGIIFEKEMKIRASNFRQIHGVFLSKTILTLFTDPVDIWIFIALQSFLCFIAPRWYIFKKVSCTRFSLQGLFGYSYPIMSIQGRNMIPIQLVVLLGSIVVDHQSLQFTLP
ncbi:hypothetical protein ACJX0J_034154 [Zea mays]